MAKKSKFPFGVLLLGAVVAGGVFVSSSSMFERDLPNIDIQTNGYWNLKTPIKIKIDDESGIKSYKVSLISKDTNTVLSSDTFITPNAEVDLEVKPPRSAYAMRDKDVVIVVQAQDASKWNFFNGNIAQKQVKLHIDKKRPQVNIVKNSYKISKGGSAVVIFQAVDDNLDEVYVESNGKKFKVQPFYKDGYYITLLAWPITKNSFRATVYAKDFAGNLTKTYVPLYLKNRQYRVSNIRLKDRFLDGKIANLAEDFIETQGVEDKIERFQIINEDVRAKNEKLIHEITSKVPDEKIDDFKINRMYPLKNAKVVASFGDHRNYFYNGKKVSEAYHVGLDLASNAMAAIKPQNGGEVVFADYNGLYGNMPIIYHGLGLYTLYGHCSTLHVNSGDIVTPRETIANTGKTGYAMGDHLHFGVLVQGIEVRPQEWMDKRWIRTNITNIIRKAKKIIDRN